MQRGFTARRLLGMISAWGVCMVFMLSAPVQADSEFQPVAPQAGDGSAAEASSENARRSDRTPRTITPPGEEAGRPLSRPEGAAPSLGAFWSTLGALGIVVVLILGLARVWKKHGPMAGIGGEQGTIELIGRRVIGPRQTIFLVRLGSRVLVIGASPEGLRTLAEVTDPVEVDYLAGFSREPDAENGWTQTFRSLFRKRSSHSAGEEAIRERGENSPEADLAEALRPAAHSREPSLEGAHG